MRLKTVPALLWPNNSWVYPRKETAVISLGPISGQKYLQQGYNFTAGAVGAALSDLLLLCIKLSQRSVHSNVLTRKTRLLVTAASPIGREWQFAYARTSTFIKGLFLCQSGINNWYGWIWMYTLVKVHK